MTEMESPRRETWRRVAIAAVVLTAAAVGCTRVWDSDVPQHVASGQWMLHHGQILGLAGDPFSVEGPSRFINVHWGFQVLVAVLYGLSGFVLLTILKMAAFAGTVAIICTFLSRRVGPAWVLLCGLVLVLGLEARVRVRPELVTFLLLAATLVILESTRADGKLRRLWWLAPINIVWVNTHGLFVLGLACLAMALAGDWLDRLLRRKDVGKLAQLKALPAAILAVAAVMIVTPWPIEAALHPLLLSSRISGASAIYTFGVEELRPAYLLNPFSNLPMAVAAVLALSVLQLMLHAFRRVPVWHWLLLGLFVTLAALAMRNIAIFAIPGVLLLGRYGPAWLDDQRAHWPWLEKLSPATPPVLLGACVLLAGLCLTEHFYRWQGRETRSGLWLQKNVWPVRTASFLASSGLSGDILPLNFGDGGAFDLYAWPEHKIWIDGRLEVQSAARFEKLYELRTRMLTKETAGDIQQTQLPPTVRFLFARWDDFKLQESLRHCDRFQLLYIEPVGVCFARKLMPGEKAEQLAAWEKAQPLPPSNLDEYDGYAGLDPLGKGLPQFTLPWWFHCNPPPMLFRLGVMFYSLGLDDMAVRYLTVSPEWHERSSNLERVAVLAQAHQRLAEGMAIEPDESLPADANLSRALALYETLNLRDLAGEDAQGLAVMKVRALLFGRQMDAAWQAMQEYLDNLPIPQRWRPPTPAITLRDQIHQALRLAQTKAESFTEKLLSAELHARLLLRKDMGLIDAAIGVLKSAKELDASGRMLLGDLYLRKGQPAKARDVYAKLPPSQDVTLRLGLCDWVAGDFPSADTKLHQAASTPAGAFYYALLLEQWGQYSDAKQVLGPAPTTQPDNQLAKQMARLRARLAGGTQP